MATSGRTSTRATPEHRTGKQRGSSEIAERLLDGADVCFAKRGLSTTLTDLADEVGVSRPTVYRYYADLDDVLRRLGMRQLRSFIAAAESSMPPSPTLADQLADRVMAVLTGFPVEQRIPAFQRPEVRERAYHMVTRHPDYAAELRTMFQPLLEQAAADAQLRYPDRVDEAIELIARFLDSIVTFPTPDGQRDKQSIEEFVRRYLIPALLHV